ncbi:MAG: YibE/F family protein [Parcubacteria group bacterium]
MRKLLLLVIGFFSLTIPSLVSAQEVHQDIQGLWRAEVIRVVSEEEVSLPGTEATHPSQVLEVTPLEGEREGESIIFTNDFVQLEAGDKFFLYYLIDINGEEMFSVRDIDRRPVMLWFLGAFILATILLGGKQGVKALLSLLGTFFVILYILVPSLLAGYPPVITSTLIASLILAIVIYVTHGWNNESHTAFAGTVAGVITTGILAYIGVAMATLTGFASDEAVYLNFNTPGLDFSGLLLGGIIIGALGVLDDIAVTQSAVVSELYGSSPTISRREAYRRALRVGKEHVGALVNTLALAYTGAALPLLLLFSTSDSSVSSILNQEVFATEIIRTITGSIGLIMTVPITTLLAVFFLEKHRGKPSEHTHSHSHGH